MIDKGSKMFFPLLAVLFIALKLTGVIAWSCWWVLAPIWIPSLVIFIISCIVLWKAG